MQKKDVKPLFKWVVENSEPKTLDRILVKLMPSIIAEKQHITPESACSSDRVEVSTSLYDLVQKTAEELVGEHYKEAV